MVFRRLTNSPSYLLFKEKWSKIITVDNAAKINKKTIHDFFKDANENWAAVYGMSILKKYIETKNNYSSKFIKTCFSIAQNFEIKLTGEEQSYIFEQEAIGFALIRNFKELSVPVSLSTGVTCFARMPSITRFKIDEGDILTNMKRGELFFTNVYMSFFYNKSEEKVYYDEIEIMIIESFGVKLKLVKEEKSIFWRIPQVDLFQIYIYYVIKVYFKKQDVFQIQNYNKKIRRIMLEK